MRFLIIDAREVEQLWEKGAVVVDVRSRKEYKEGHFHGAVNIPEPEAEELFQRIDGHKKYILYCEHGSRSMELARDLGRMGRTVGTVLGGWKKMKKTVS